MLRTPLAVETSRAKLLGRYTADAEKNTEEMLKGALGGAVFFDEMHTLHERGYRQGGPCGNAIVNTLLLYIGSHRDVLVVFGASYQGDGPDAGGQSRPAAAIFDADRVPQLHSVGPDRSTPVARVRFPASLEGILWSGRTEKSLVWQRRGSVGTW